MAPRTRKTAATAAAKPAQRKSPAKAATAKKTTAPPKATRRTLDARPDSLDFRDNLYVPTLVEVPIRRELAEYRKAKVPILDQGQQGACTGYGLATVAHYLLRTRQYKPDATDVSPQMFYDMAKRYDEWAGVEYDGSSCRGAMKGWYKHGICKDANWPAGKAAPTFSSALAAEASERPLGAYFRVNHTDIVAMHAALAEVGVLYASANVHAGWEAVDAKSGRIPPSDKLLGGHAFAIVAYDEDGFWVQNSWGPTWGYQGFGHLSYDDWLANGSDTWVARLGAPIRSTLVAKQTNSAAGGSASFSMETLRDVRPHVISLGNNGLLDPQGDIGTTADGVNEIFTVDFPRLTQGWKKKRIVVYAHGGLVGQGSAIETVSGYRQALLDAECYPLAFIWHSDFWTTLGNILADAMRRRRPEGVLDASLDFMLDRADDLLEPLARVLSGKAEWDEMKENALLATTGANGGARLAAGYLAQLAQAGVEIHLVGHSAGSILLAPLVQYLTTQGAMNGGPMAGNGLQGLNVSVASCHLWAPACTMQLFLDAYLQPIQNGRIGRFGLFTLTDQAERDDNCARIYNKSLLYLVSNAFEDQVRIPLIHPDGEPILGMATFIRKTRALMQLFKAGGNADWVQAPNNLPAGDRGASAARHHGDFDNDDATVRATLARILNARAVAQPMAIAQSTSAMAQRRQQMLQASTRR
ncbi:C1 family peptidase [Pseudomonas knackmussii]|uniref:C1 family peptidase n=1 Tax=Pseudomonas knackmussii TaxID=65741 RepID=UPI003F49CB53